MVRMCPGLNRRVKILASQKRLIFLPTNSFYQVLSAEAYSKHGFNIHGAKISELQKQHQELSDSIADIKHRKGLINQYHKELEKQENPITEFDENMFNSLVDHGTVFPDGRIIFTFNDGSEIYKSLSKEL